MANESKRIVGPDIVRVIAALFVVCVHFYFNCGYYNMAMNSKVMILMTAARWLFLCCVPLYMLLTGYLKCNKTPSKAHYLSIVPVFVAYIVISIIKVFVGNHYYGKVYGIKEAIQAMGNYTIAWYVGFYFSLMAITPFLNKMWHAIDSKKEKHVLLFSLALISSLFPLTGLLALSNVYPLALIGSFLEILTPNYWQMIYPLLYYFLGCYIREYKPNFKKSVLFALLTLMVGIETLISYKYAAGGTFNWNILGATDCGYNCITVVISAVCIFLLFYNCDIKSAFIKNVLAKISGVSLEIYLFSAIFDIIIFDYAKKAYSSMNDYAWLFFILVPINFIGSLICSLVYKKIYSLCHSFVLKLKKH